MEFSKSYISEDENIVARYDLEKKPNPDLFKMHIHEKLEIYCFIQGDSYYLIEGVKYMLKPGSILIIQSSESHMAKLLSSKPYERYAIEFSPEVVDSIDPDHFLLEPFYNRNLGTDNLFMASEFKDVNPLTLLSSMFNDNENKSIQKVELLSNLYLMLSEIRKIYLTRQQTTINKKPVGKTEEIIAYINEHLYENISLDYLSETFYFSISQLNRNFIKLTGTTIRKYIQIKRLIAAKTKIKNGTSAVVAAQECGFNEYSSFFRAYKNYFGYPPSKDLK